MRRQRRTTWTVLVCIFGFASILRIYTNCCDAGGNVEERGGQSYPPLITTKTKNSWTKDGNDGTTKNGLPLIPPYSTTNIIEAALSVIIAPARLLVYNAASDEVVVCSMAPHMVALDIGEYFNTCNRCRFILPILVPE